MLFRTLLLATAHAHALQISHTCVPTVSIVGRACKPTMSSAASATEEAAKQAWLARLDVPTWGKGVVEPTAPKMSEDEAKKAWLARLDVPTWGKAKSAVVDIQEMAIESQAREEEAKQAWLARLDVPAWGKAVEAAVSAVAEVSTEVAEEPALSAEEIAKHAWLAKLDAPTWGQKSPEAREEEAKKAWLARLDAPSWGMAAKAMADVAQEATALQEMTTACDQGDDAACESLSREEEAKKAWLARLDVPAWGAAAAAVSAVATQVGA